MKYEHLLFDLDGTLTESAPGIINSIQYALKSFGISETDPERLKLYIGPPLMTSLTQIAGLPEDDARKAMKIYHDYYSEKGLFENSVYDGIPETLQKLKAAGKKLYIATSKPELFMRRIIEKFGIADFFDFAGGSDIEETRAEKWQVIQYVVKSCSLEGAVADGRVLMIGDRKHDIEGARKNNIPTMGVLFGYGTREELTEYGASLIAQTPEDIARIILSEDNPS